MSTIIAQLQKVCGRIDLAKKQGKLPTNPAKTSLQKGLKKDNLKMAHEIYDVIEQIRSYNQSTSKPMKIVQFPTEEEIEQNNILK